jgi:signal peptidase I
VVLQPASRPQVPAQSASKGRGVLSELVQVGLLALVLFLVIHLAVQPVRVIGSSMYPTVSDQDYLIATTIDYRFHPPQRGDIVILRDPYDASLDFIKRVIALPGEHLLIRSGHVYINARLLSEPYLNNQEQWTANADWPTTGTQDPQGALVPANDYFVMGDNRNHSSDSRSFGFIPRSSIEARGWIRVLPLPELGTIDREKPTLAPTASLAA